MGAAPHEAAGRAAERAARLSYGRLVAHLARAWRDVAAAEDALGDAFARALENWPRTGVPDNPDAWLLVAARRRLTDGARAAAVRRAAADTLAAVSPDPEEEAMSVPDRRLVLMAVCAHPAIDPAARTPMMLQTVLGLDAARIASAFLVPPATMGQRLVRAKARIRDAGIRFELPDPEELPARAEAIREAVYAAYGTGWDAAPAASSTVRGLAEEAIWLGRVLAEQMPSDPETAGLVALMLYAEARRAARRGPDGSFVPLDRQSVARWDRAMIDEADALLAAAARAGAPGRFQLEAAIQSTHVEEGLTGRDLRRPRLALATALETVAPTIANRLGRAAAAAEAEGPEAGLALLDALPAERIADHQPAFALRGHLYARLGRTDEARAALTRAAGLTDDPAVRAFLLARAADL